MQKELAEKYNPDGKPGTLRDAMKGADVFIGVSAAGLVDEDMVRSMNDDAIVFAHGQPGSGNRSGSC